MITASVVIYNSSEEDLRAIINSTANSIISEVYIIDNSLNDKMGDFVRGGSEKNIYIQGHGNVGYGTGHNMAIQKSIKSGAKYHIVLNPDIEFAKDVIEKLVVFMDQNPDCGLVMPQIRYPNNDVQYLCKLLPTPMDLFVRRFSPFKKWNQRRDFKYELRSSRYTKIMNVPSLSGCFMFMRVSSLTAVGGFDERYFMYAEDLDLCRRIGEVAHTIFNPEVSVIHKYEKGSYKNRKLLLYHISSVVKYFNKWGWFYDKRRSLINRRCLKNIESNSK